MRKDGNRFWADVLIAALYDSDGNLRGFSKVVRDITARKRAEEEIEALNADLSARASELEAFNYMVSHDLRKPLSHINAFYQLVWEQCRRQTR